MIQCQCCERRLGQSIAECDCAATYCSCLNCHLHCTCDQPMILPPATFKWESNDRERLLRIASPISQRTNMTYDNAPPDKADTPTIIEPL